MARGGESGIQPVMHNDPGEKTRTRDEDDDEYEGL